MGACYGVTTPAASMIRQTLWAQKTGKTPAPKLCILPRQRKHLSKTSLINYIAQWYNVLDSDPPNLNVVNFGWEVDYTNKFLNTWQMEYHMLQKIF